MVPLTTNDILFVPQSKALDLVVLVQKGVTCYAMPRVRFPPARWVARRDEPELGLWRYEGEWTRDLKRYIELPPALMKASI